MNLSQGEKVKGICCSLGITEQTYYRWRKDYGGMKVSQARRLKALERENGRLKKAVAELTLDKLILKEAFEHNAYDLVGEWKTRQAIQNHFKTHEFKVLIGAARVPCETFEMNIAEVPKAV